LNKLKVFFIILITLLIISTVGFIIVGKYQIAKSNDYIYQNKHKR